MGRFHPLCRALVHSVGARFKVFTKYYILTRYPNAVVGTLPNGLPGKDEAEKTLAMFSQILKFLEERLRPEE